MAASDKNYRSQKTLDIVFAVSCVLMFLSILWMLYDDYSRPFKAVQRKFRDVETGIFENAMLDKFPEDHTEFDELQNQVEAARKAKKEEEGKLKDHLKSFLDSHPQESRQYEANPDRWIKAKLTRKTNLQTDYQNTKSTIDSKTSFYNEEMEKAGAVKDEKLRKAHLDHAEHLAAEISALTDKLNKTRRQIDEIDSDLAIVQGDVKKAEDQLSKAEDDLKKLTADFDRLAKSTAQKRWKSGDFIRALPILDGFASPVKPNQITLKALTIDYGGFADVTRYDRCTTCHLGIDRFNFDKASLRRLANDDKEASGKLQKKLDSARKFLLDRQKLLAAHNEDLGFDPNDLPKTITSVKLSSAEITEYCAHPRLELFVDANSKHPMEKFGCTICHAGQGSATDFTLAVHTPADMKQEEEWKKEHGWAPTHDWEFPMYSSRFVESSCLKCHHQVTDLITHGSREEAPKLLKGYNLVKENGCFGCHEIAGIKSGREVGPDLRLEPNPPLESLTPEERTRAMSDPTNPPGTLRKVGPSLYRITEKTNEKWARSWLNNPRGFRADTKMPHFYNVSNNNKDALPKDQQEFPGAEMHSIISYLFQSSDDYLKGQDDYRKGLVKKKAEIEEKLKRQEPPLTDFEKKKLTKDLEDAEERYKYVKDPPTPIAGQIVDEFGKSVELLAPPNAVDEAAHRTRGRQLFSEKGCLACHSHQGTMKAGPDTPAVNSEATFGPNLSRIADKVAPEGGKDKRRWLVQWILNPTVHHPRTRMPITHLVAADAADIADWLLSQSGDSPAMVRYPEVADWKDADVAEPTLEALTQLARVYLLKAPGMTQAEVDDLLKDQKGMTEERAKSLAADADERKLVDKLDAKKLKWYIGKKSVARLGCYACHNVPGFETAKPIGTALNDWGAKDPNRLAFEEADVWVKEYRNIITERDSATKKGQPADDWKAKDGKPPYEEYFYQALEHHQRDGFLHQKLSEPRSYDYKRLRAWDDLLRMPQFHFSHLPKREEGEEDDAYQSRIDKEEDEAREAVMTFILGLVAEPIPLAYVNEPKGDRLHEVKGRKVLDKYNCAGCHQLAPGVLDYKLTADAHALLDKSLARAKASLAGDHVFKDDNAWVGQDPPAKDLLRIYGVNPRDGSVRVNDDDVEETKIQRQRLARALRFTGEKGPQDLPAGEEVMLLPDNMLNPSSTWGGAFPDLMMPYLQKKDSQRLGSEDKARSALPPPLEREGERTQPMWLYGFLKNPEPIRPTTWMALRMPKFNLSDEEAMQIVNYFAAVDRLENPGVGLTAPYLTIPQRDDKYWTDRDRAYTATIGKDRLVYWTKEYLTGLKDKLKAADEERKNAKPDDLPKAQKRVADLEKKSKDVEELLGKLNKADSVKKEDFPELRKEIVEQRPYASDAYRLLLNPQLCLQCHQIGQIQVKGGAQGPPLDLSAERLRPEWTQRWMANPNRLFTYSPNMPSNFAKNADNFREFFDGLPFEQATALRDVLMNLPKIADLPSNRKITESVGGK
jgi:mono/diheme cytochrome c family protein